MNEKDFIKNWSNAFLASMIKIGDRVRVLRTGEVGTVTKIVAYNRDNGKWCSPFGYSAIQVRFDNYNDLPRHRKVRHYSAKSLEVISKI